MNNVVSYYSKLAGVTFDDRQETIASMSPGTPLRFRREPENEYDSNAVAVDALVSDTWRPIGYIARDKNSEIARILLEGKYAKIELKDKTGGGDKSYGVNVYIEHEKELKPVRSPKAVLVTDIFGNEIFYDDDLHEYTNALGEVYLSGSKYADQFERPFDAKYISNMMATKRGLTSEDAEMIQEMWDLKSLASRSFGTAMHAALELYGRFKSLSVLIGKDTYLHDNPVLKKAVESFYGQYPDIENVAYECLVVDHTKKRAGRIDRLEYDADGGVWIADFKTNTDIKKSLKKYWLQLSFYAAVIRANGMKVKGLRIYTYDGDKWKTIEGKVVEIDRLTDRNPDILMHPNIPKPLHEVNPRNIMGQEKWDKLRQEVYASTDYHCIACGVHKDDAEGPKWLEAHEFYEIDYENGRVEIKKIIPLCHYCHNFIHSGRLSMIVGKDKSKEEVVSILEHGFRVLEEAGLPAFYFTIDLANHLGANTYGVKAAPKPKENSIEWGDWRLVWEGVEYPPKYKTYEEWKARWSE